MVDLLGQTGEMETLFPQQLYHRQSYNSYIIIMYLKLLGIHVSCVYCNCMCIHTCLYSYHLCGVAFRLYMIFIDCNSSKYLVYDGVVFCTFV